MCVCVSILFLYVENTHFVVRNAQVFLLSHMPESYYVREKRNRKIQREREGGGGEGERGESGVDGCVLKLRRW